VAQISIGHSTDVEENNVVWAKITESGALDQALVIFHHWNASARNRQIAKFFSQRGITVVEIAMPYHLERSRPGSLYADYMLSSNLGRTIQSVRQAVWDGRKLIRWLKSEGYREVLVLGMSLGSWVAEAAVLADEYCVFQIAEDREKERKVRVGRCLRFRRRLATLASIPANWPGRSLPHPAVSPSLRRRSEIDSRLYR